MTEATQPGSPDKLYGAAEKRLATFEVLLPRVIAATKLAIGVAELIADKRARESGSDDGLEALKMLYAALVALAEAPQGSPTERMKTERKSTGALVFLTERQICRASGEPSIRGASTKSSMTRQPPRSPTAGPCTPIGGWWGKIWSRLLKRLSKRS